MKKMIVVLAVLVLTFALVIPASANGNGPATGRNASTGSETGPEPQQGSGSGQPDGVGSGQPEETGSGRPKTASKFAFAGTITAIGANTVTIKPVGGNKVVQPFLSSQLTVAVNAQTRYVLRDDTTATLITFADLQVGQQVSVQGTFADNIWTANRITVGARLSCLQ